MSEQEELEESTQDLADELRNFQEIARALRPSPGEIPCLKGIDIAGITLPLKAVIGGDHIIYIDFTKRYDLEARIAQSEAEGRPEVGEKLRLNRHRGGILLADVSGHRSTDALIAAMLHQAFLLGAYYELDIYGEITTRLFEHINTRFYKTTAINKYLTMIYGEIAEEGRFRFISAGHPRPMVFSREFARFVPISEDRLVSYPPVGMFPSATEIDERRRKQPHPVKREYTVNEIDLLSPGDVLLLYTDGLIEHGAGVYFPEQVERNLAKLTGCTAAEICEYLKRDLLGFAPPEDDISFVVIKKLPGTNVA